MRHFFLAGPVATLSRGMTASPCRAGAGNACPAHRTASHRAAGRSLRRNRFGRGRSSYRSRPACGNPRRGTAVPMLPRHEMAERRWTYATIARILALHACPARCGARRRALTAKFRSRRRACPQERSVLPASGHRASAQANTAWDNARHHRTINFKNSNGEEIQAVSYLAPDLRGFTPPSTIGQGSRWCA